MQAKLGEVNAGVINGSPIMTYPRVSGDGILAICSPLSYIANNVDMGDIKYPPG